LINAWVQEHLDTYKPNAEVKIRISLTAQQIRERIQGLPANSNIPFTFDADINSLEIVTDDAGQTVYLTNEV
jgi:hypothetical protein